AGDRLLDFIRPKLPQLRSEAAPPPNPTAPTIAATPKETLPPLDSTFVIANSSSDPFHPASGAGWGGSILGGRWIASPTSTSVPGILWSNPPQPAANGFSYSLRSYAVGPLAMPTPRAEDGQQRVPVIMSAPYAIVPQKPRRQPQSESPPDAKPQNESKPGGVMHQFAPVELASITKVVEPAPFDGRWHPTTPISSVSLDSISPQMAVNAGTESFVFGNGSQTRLDFPIIVSDNVNTNVHALATAGTISSDVNGFVLNVGHPHHIRQVHSNPPPLPPADPTRLTFDSAS